MAQVLAVDVGGTKLAVGLVDEFGRHTGVEVRPSQPRDGEAFFALVVETCRQLIGRADTEPVGVGVGCGGPMEQGRVSPVNIPGWRGFDLAGRLADELGLPVALDNDAKAFALAEGWVGAARGCSDYLAMVVSTGVGGGIVSGGRLLEGATGNAGHIGHLVVEPGGRRHAGIEGTLEGEASGTAIAARTGAPAAECESAERVRAGTLVGRAIGGVANLLDLRLAVVGGGVALGFGEPFLGAARAECERVARLDHSRGTRIELSSLGPFGSLIGAGALAWRAQGRVVLGC